MSLTFISRGTLSVLFKSATSLMKVRWSTRKHKALVSNLYKVKHAEQRDMQRDPDRETGALQGLPWQQYFTTTRIQPANADCSGVHKKKRSCLLHIWPGYIFCVERAAWRASDLCKGGYTPSPGVA